MLTLPEKGNVTKAGVSERRICYRVFTDLLPTKDCERSFDHIVWCESCTKMPLPSCLAFQVTRLCCGIT
ncbi:hypothetical protein TNCV_1811941 [Trichonephila clavipes]|uniref:Uncharacterized protein n=1 Tax=Trichonephila clavipes TaxID=2585209 RepID=A0A8X7BGF6_TRICX|nr:hypothetical protein TNCV_1811941 [Trichonephila clavipes]